MFILKKNIKEKGRPNNNTDKQKKCRLNKYTEKSKNKYK